MDQPSTQLSVYCDLVTQILNEEQDKGWLIWTKNMLANIFDHGYVLDPKKIKANADYFIEAKTYLQKVRLIYMTQEGNDQLFDAPGKYEVFKMFIKGNFLYELRKIFQKHCQELHKSDQCWLCFTQFTQEEQLSILPKFSCGEHVLHYECMQQWIKAHGNNQCMVCKK